MLFSSPSNVHNPSTFSNHLCRFVKLQEVQRQDRSILYKLTTGDGKTLNDVALPVECPARSLEVLQQIVRISETSQRKTACRAFCVLSQEADCSNGAGTCFLLSARILLPNQGELLTASIFDRRLILENCGLPCTPREEQPWSPRDFYQNVFVPNKTGTLPSFPRIDELKCQLYPFQQRAIQWLLHREGGGDDPLYARTAQLTHGFVKTVDADGKPCFISPFLGIVTDSLRLVWGASEIKGGILAEEMGLGKTVEIIGLICLNKQPKHSRDQVSGPPSLRTCGATLIITPPSILGQWKNELQTLASDVKVTTYEGLYANNLDDETAFDNIFDTHDVVMTSYNVLAREIHHAEHVPERLFRNQKKYERRLSPLMQRNWWRVVLDEAQMVESGVSNAAKVAQLIPRVNAWCVSGTPVRRSSQDLRGLLVFLRFPPYCWSSQLWERLITERRDILRQILGTLALRHTKEQIKDEIQLPPQRRIIIKVPFTQIEKQNYLNLYNQMCDDCGLDNEGAPVTESWVPDDSITVAKMRRWLLRLRQTCLHAEVGVSNRKALGKRNNPLRTVDEVLEVMTEQNLNALRMEERAVLVSQARKGQLLEHAKRSREALNIWLETLKESQSLTLEARSRLEADECAGSLSEGEKAKKVARHGIETENSNGALRIRLRLSLELEHMLLFFAANGYYQIKSDEKETGPGSSAFDELGRCEDEYYEKAKLVRKEILVESRIKADLLIDLLREKGENQSFATIPVSGAQMNCGGIESRNVLEQFAGVTRIIDRQAQQINKWRAEASKLLLVPLVDEEETDLQGDEYEMSTQQQDTVYSYVDVLRAIVADYHNIVTGQSNLLIDHEMKVALQRAIQGEGHSPDLLQELLRVRQKLRPSAGTGSVRGVITQLRELRHISRGQLERGNVRAGAELGIINTALDAIQTLSVQYSKTALALEREVELLTNIMNARLEYYRQLQQISDTVAPLEEELDDLALAAALTEADTAERTIHAKIAGLRSTARYLDHLRTENDPKQVSRLCIICQQSFEVGVLTSCGHAYCAECLGLWRKHHATCPTCKKGLKQSDLYQITYKPSELTVQEERPLAEQAETSASGRSSQSIYTDISTSTLHEIKNIDIDAKGSFGTKIDSIARHVMWLREHDPGSKSIVFSQFRDFLSVLGVAFANYKIGHASIDAKNGVRKFQQDAGTECLLMHARGSSSGLSLVNATHVFLCEPLINTAIELQAIARVHRIGQQQTTTVWVYVVEDTVEQSVYDISVERRMKHMAKKCSGGTMESQIAAADTLELEEGVGKLLGSGRADGEVVDEGDLWHCLFQHRPGQKHHESPTVDREVERHVRAAVAERRQDDDEL
ncbi:MAG: hypothetical protein Q9168_001878 [Polycauliona sp. 1 TL-2023]